MSQVKLLQKAEGGALSPDAVNDLHDVTDYALMAMKCAAQAIGKDNGFLVILQRHLLLNLANLKDADRKVLLNAPVTPSGLFGDAVESIIERFVEAFQKQIMRSRSTSVPGLSQRRETKVPRQEPDVQRKVWGLGKRRHGQQRSPLCDYLLLSAAKPSSWQPGEKGGVHEWPSPQAPQATVHLESIQTIQVSGD